MYKTNDVSDLRNTLLDGVAKIGVIETYKQVKAAYPEKVSLNMLYGLQAALMGINWKDLPLDIKEELKSQLNEGD